MKKREYERSRGFTLIELLVVIAIIGILAAIMFPVFARAREKARQVSCISNLKQLGLAALMYADSWDERFPPFYYETLSPEGEWHYQYWYALEEGSYPDYTYNFDRGLLMPFIGTDKLLRCPSFHPTHAIYGDGLGYGYNYSLSMPPVYLANVDNSGTIMFGDAGLHYLSLIHISEPTRPY